jgi:hypothetical protein
MKTLQCFQTKQANRRRARAASLMANWKDLLAEPPKIEKVDVLAAKLSD